MRIISRWIARSWPFILPFWEALRQRPDAQAALRSVNAAVVGLLAAAFYNPVWTAGILNATNYAIALAAFVLLLLWKAPSWLVVLLAAAAGQAAVMLR